MTGARLADLAAGRDNNLNLIRMVAATAVLVSHAWPLALGAGTPEPLFRETGHALGTLAVFVFFAISGFLITASFDRSRDAGAFLAARSLRLFPALFVSVMLVAFVMGPAVTTLPVAEYLSHPGTLAFVPRNMALVSPAYYLPGVFETNPYPAVEGSIWTLVHEVACYLGVLAAGLAGAFATRRRLLAALLCFAVAWIAYQALGGGLHPKVDALHRLSLPFAIGAAFYVLRDRIPLSAGIAAALAAVAVALAVLGAPWPVGYAATLLTLSYAVFWIAYVPRGPILGYNRIGDYSYGIYIYAFPIQGLVVWIWGPMTPWENIALALPFTLVLAILSWHLVEAPALALRHRLRRGGARPAGEAGS